MDWRGQASCLGLVRFGVEGLRLTVWVSGSWTPKVCKIMALMAIFRGFGLLFYLLLGSRLGLS